MVVGGAGGGIRTEKSNGGILQCGGEKDREKSNWWRLSAGYKGATFCQCCTGCTVSTSASLCPTPEHAVWLAD